MLVYACNLVELIPLVQHGLKLVESKQETRDQEAARFDQKPNAVTPISYLSNTIVRFSTTYHDYLGTAERRGGSLLVKYLQGKRREWNQGLH